MRIEVNGRELELEAGATVQDAVRALGLRPEVIAVERNRSLVPRSTYAEVRLEPGDVLEVVTLVGGG